MRNKQTKRGIFMSVTVTINAKPYEVADEHLEMSLLRYLREVLGLTGVRSAAATAASAEAATCSSTANAAGRAFLK